MLTQAVHHGVQHSRGSRGDPRVLSVEVVCDRSDDGEQHGMYAVFQERNHLRKGLQGPLAHFLVGILKPRGKSVKDLLGGGGNNQEFVGTQARQELAGTPSASLKGVPRPVLAHSQGRRAQLLKGEQARRRDRYVLSVLHVSVIQSPVSH